MHFPNLQGFVSSRAEGKRWGEGGPIVQQRVGMAPRDHLHQYESLTSHSGGLLFLSLIRSPSITHCVFLSPAEAGVHRSLTALKHLLAPSANLVRVCSPLMSSYDHPTLPRGP